MKAAYLGFVVLMAYITLSMADKIRKDGLEEKSDQMFQNNDFSKRGECKDKWYQVFCKVVKAAGRCDSPKGKEKCAKTCGHCGIRKPNPEPNPCADKYSIPKCLYLQETNKCYTDDARANCGTTCESCGKACKNYIKECADKKILDELCTVKSGGFLLCPRGCNLCIDPK